MPTPAHKSGVFRVNQEFYDALWSGMLLIDPARFTTWPLVKELAEAAPRRLEVGPGLRPRLPVPGTHFADISEPALAKLASAGGHVETASITRLPYLNDFFDLVCALDIIEHVEDDAGALDELCRVARPGATLLLSVPLHPGHWTSFDDLVGHCRRYEPTQLRGLLADHLLTVMRSARYGMKPESSRLVNWGMLQLRKHPKRALWIYNHLIMPLGLRCQKPMVFQNDMIDMDDVGEIFIVCRLEKAPGEV